VPRLDTRRARAAGEFRSAEFTCPVRPADEDLGDGRLIRHASKFRITLDLAPADLADQSLVIDLSLEGTVDGTSWFELARGDGWRGGTVGKDGAFRPPHLGWFSEDNRLLQRARIRWRNSKQARIGLTLDADALDIDTTTHHSIGDRAVAGSETSGTNLTYSHSVAGSVDLAIWVCSSVWRSGGTSDPTGVTYAGAALTKQSGNFMGGGSNDNSIVVWRRAAPATGANNVVITCAASSDITGVSISYSGVDQTTPNDAPVANDVTSATPSHAISSATDDMVVSFVGWWGGSGAGAAAATGSLTERLDNSNAMGVNSLAVGDAPGGASVTVGWTISGAGDLHGQISFNVNQAVGGGPITSTVSGSQPAATGVVSRLAAFKRTLLGAQPSATGAVARAAAFKRTLAGAQPAASGVVSRLASFKRTLAGAQPSAEGSLTYLRNQLRSATGSQPAATGAVTSDLIEGVTRSVTGNQPAPSGVLTRVLDALRAMGGAQPAATGTLSRRAAFRRALAGNQPAPSATLTRLRAALRTLTGAQPAPSGTVTRTLSADRTVSGNQPAPSGSVTAVVLGTGNARFLTGNQPAATGLLTFVPPTRAGSAVEAAPLPVGAAYATGVAVAAPGVATSNAVTWYGTPSVGSARHT
jgi:hypothetical protein